MKNTLKTLLITFLAVFSFSCKPYEMPDLSGSGSNSGSGAPIMEVPDQFILLTWTGVTDINMADWQLPKMVEAGFNTYLGWWGTIEDVEKLLTSADNAGIKIITSCPELETDTKNAVERMTAHESFYGYHIEDEPEVSEFPILADRINKILKYDTEHPCYVNVYPNWAWGGENGYLSKLRKFLKEVPVPFLSFDNYPIKNVGGQIVIRPDWYHNLEDIRTAAKEAEMPFWSFALALSHKTAEANYPRPTLAQMRLQQFSNMVYGAVAFQYFTGWGYIQNGNIVKDVYDIVKQVNSELKSMQKIFLGANIKGVWHTGDNIPSGTKKLNILPSGVTKLQTSASGAIVSSFTNNGKNYMAVVNKNCEGPMALSVGFKVDNVVTIAKGGAQAPVQENYQIEAGDILIFCW